MSANKEQYVGVPKTVRQAIEELSELNGDLPIWVYKFGHYEIPIFSPCCRPDSDGTEADRVLIL